jgi:hypothetical protein
MTHIMSWAPACQNNQPRLHKKIGQSMVTGSANQTTHSARAPLKQGHSLVWLRMHRQHASPAEQVAAHALICADPAWLA